MVSGVDPKETLEQCGITVVADLPRVGQDLQDQPLIGMSYRVNVPTSSNMINDPIYAAEATISHLANGTGPITDPPGLLAFERISDNPPIMISNSTLSALKHYPADRPQFEYLTQNGYSGFNRNYQTADPVDGHNYVTVATVVVSLFSRGNATVSFTDALIQPDINPNWLTTPEDVDIAVASFKRFCEIWSHINVTIMPEYLLGPNVTNDAQIIDYMWHRFSRYTMRRPPVRRVGAMTRWL